MSFPFTEEQIAEINRLAAGTSTSVYNNPDRPNSGAYEYMLSFSRINSAKAAPDAYIGIGWAR